MEILKENFWTVFCLVIGAILTIIGSVRIFLATKDFNKNLSKDTQTLITGQDSIQLTQIVSAKVEAETKLLVTKNKDLLEKNGKLDELNHKILGENRLLNLENRKLVKETKTIISEDI